MRTYAQPVLADVPQEELYLLSNAIDAATVEASSGQAGEGYSELAYGLRRAEFLCRDGIPWARDLVVRYETALQEFCTRCGG